MGGDWPIWLNINVKPLDLFGFSTLRNISEEDLFRKITIGSGLKDDERIDYYEGYVGFLSPGRFKGSLERIGDKILARDERGVVKETSVLSGNRIDYYEGYVGFLSPGRFKGSLERIGDKILARDERGVVKETSVLSGGSSSSGTICFVATAVYGDPEALQVKVLRDFRDNVLVEHPLGKRFVDFYYSGAGKRTADFIKEHLPSAIPLIRRGLDALVERYSAQRK